MLFHWGWNIENSLIGCFIGVGVIETVLLAVLGWLGSKHGWIIRNSLVGCFIGDGMFPLLGMFIFARGCIYLLGKFINVGNIYQGRVLADSLGDGILVLLFSVDDLECIR